MSHVKVNLEELEKVLVQSNVEAALARLVGRYRELERIEVAVRTCAHAKVRGSRHCPQTSCPNYVGNFEAQA